MTNYGKQHEKKLPILEEAFEKEIDRRSFLQKTTKFAAGAVGLTLFNSLGGFSVNAESRAPVTVTMSSNPTSSKLYTIDFKSTDELARYTRLSSLQATQP